MNSKYTTLSAAIKAGSKVTSQTFGTYENLAGDTCALGAAHVALGKPCHLFGVTAAITDFFPYAQKVATSCPVCSNGGRYQLASCIIHLNDDHHWTREHIADFVEQFENEHLGYETLTESTESEVMSDAPPTLSLQQEAEVQG